MLGLNHGYKEVSQLHPETMCSTTADYYAEKDYQTVSVYPKLEELLGGAPKLELKRDLPYERFHSYVDRQFRMVREDIFGLLRVDIKKHLQNPKAGGIYENIQIYNCVSFIRSTVIQTKIGYVVKIQASEDRLTFGSLVILTRDDFETILTGTIIDRDSEDAFVVELSEQMPYYEIYNHNFTLVECKVFFEAYRHVLSVLRNLSEYEMPFKNYIMHLSDSARVPPYVRPHDNYVIDFERHRISVNVHNKNSWPDLRYTNMDAAQYQCFQAALSRELTIIQGPPGTGKSFIGLEIVKTLLNNVNLRGPILLICYTNHALDQFLEDTLKFNDRIVRFGSQSQNSALDMYNISERRRAVKSKHKSTYYKMRRTLENVSNNMNDIQSTNKKILQKEMISYSMLSPFMSVEMQSSLRRVTGLQNDPVFHWLFEHELGTMDQNYSTDKKKNKIQHCHRIFRDKMNRVRSINKTDLLDNMERPWDQPIEMRFIIYFALQRDLQNDLNLQFAHLQERYASLSTELECLDMLINQEALRGIKVLGMTTSAASRMNALLQTLNIDIVVVEEAAEVPEAHVVASLPKTVKHLIMIGDHLQLRPNTANYDLARKSDFEISLFERLVTSGVKYNSLRLQHRMRPEIAALISPLMYPDLENHERVLKYPPVKGMSANMYFLTHDRMEGQSQNDKGSTSYRNKFEAEMCVKLASYLVKMGYSPNEITLLTLYTGQSALIQDLVSLKPELENLLVKVVDNYQGEENRIVILSLVRSNKNAKVGFLNLPNRVCVALSRAREGLYIVGNMNMLRYSCRTWSEIYNVLDKNNAIGNEWPIVVCENLEKSSPGTSIPSESDGFEKFFCFLTSFIVLIFNVLWFLIKRFYEIMTEPDVIEGVRRPAPLSYGRSTKNNGPVNRRRNRKIKKNDLPPLL